MTRRFGRRTALALAGAALGAGRSHAQAWEPVAPERAGFAADLAARLEAEVAANRLPGLHGVVVARGGRLVLERYLSGMDSALGRPLGMVHFGPGTPHDLQSITKSVFVLLYGIALAEGRVPPPEAPLYAQFPAHADLARDPARARITIGDALTMRLGLEWNEDISYADPANSMSRMEQAPDRVRYVLERRVIGPPGAGWIYCGGATTLLGDVLARGTGMDISSYALLRLFDPLGIPAPEWVRARDAAPRAASGLRMTPRDMARIGTLVAAQGTWQGRSVVPPEWLRRCMQPAAWVDDARAYGLHWYVGNAVRRTQTGLHHAPWWGGYGNGGQRLWVFPSLDLVVAVTAGNYDRGQLNAMPTIILRNVVLPALTA
jgi:CubicO group peptidase (beta-lactamase class C family)